MWQINNYIWEIAQENFGVSPYDFSPINIFNEDYYQNYLEDENHPFRLALLIIMYLILFPRLQ